MSIYTAKLYEAEQEIQRKSGDNLDELYVWMLAQAHGKPGNFSGDVINNQTEEVVRHFKKGHEE